MATMNPFDSLGDDVEDPQFVLPSGLCEGGCAAIIESGTSLIAGPTVADTRGSIKDGMKGVHSQPAHNGIKGVLTSVYKEGGVRGLYRGVGPTLTGILPYAGLKFYMYEKLKMHVPEEHQKSILMRLSCVVKRQMQV